MPAISQATEKTERHCTYGVLVAGAGDVDGDGTPDLLIADPGAFEPRAVVWVVSGRDGRVLHTVFGESREDGFAVDIRAAGDVDMDGHADWIVGTGSRYNPGPKCGEAIVYSGRTGTPLHRFSCRTRGDGFGSTVSGAGDVNADGYADVIVGASDADGSGDAMGLAYVFSGRDGALLRVLSPKSSKYQRGIDVAGVGDVNGDGFGEVAVSVLDTSGPVHAPPEVHVYSGKDGSVLFSIAAPLPSASAICIVRPAYDFDGDGRPDVLVGVMGAVVAVSGRNGKPLRDWTGPVDEEFGCSVASLGHVGGDRFGDVLVGSPRAGLWSGRVDLLSGTDGLRIRRHDPPEDPHRLGCSLDALGDIDGDGIGDYVIGTDHTGAGEDGFVEVRSGKAGERIFEFRRRGDTLVATKWKSAK
jgi:hypothetical protein